MLGSLLMLRVLRSSLSCLFVFALTVALAPTSQATVIYQTGFESPFTVGAIGGQQGWINTDINATRYRIQNSVVKDGTQAFQVAQSTAGSNVVREIGPYNPVGNSETLVVLELDFLLGAVSNAIGNLNLYDPTGNIVFRAMNFADGGVRLVPQDDATSVTRETWNRYRVELDFDSSTATAYLNGVLLTTSPTKPLNIPSIGYLQFGFNGGPGGIFIDNLSITSTEPVPEPGTWAMLAAGLAGLTLLRRRQA
jgi:hypothetical protein